MFKIKKRSSNDRDKRQYCEAKEIVKRVVAAAMDHVSREAIETVKINCDGRELSRIVKHMAKKGRDVLGVNCLKDEKGEMKVTVDECQNTWKNHMEKLINAESQRGGCV